MDPTPIEVKPLTSSMLDTAASTLAQAFMADPMFEWVFPDPGTRLAKLTVLNRLPLEYALRYDLRVRHTDDGRCVAIWVPPGQSLTVVGMVRCGMLAAPFRIGFRPLARFAKANASMDPVHKQAMHGQPHWQLLIVTVAPVLQGQGRGQALLSDGLGQIDSEGMACYLDTSNPTNLPYYQRLGFEVVKEVPLGRGGPPAWGMRREPISAP
jgi:ribosomal protein S18 acetylase RimI-like enzyme